MDSKRISRLLKKRRTGIQPSIRLAFDTRAGDRQFRRVFPFRKPWIAISVLAVFDAVFIFPAVGVFGQAVTAWSRLGDLFDLVTAVFTTAWLLGWSIGPLVMTVVLLLMLFGREVISARLGMFRIFFGFPLIGLAADYKVENMRNLRFEKPEPKSGNSWRGPHLVFDYGARAVAFGSNARELDLSFVESGIQGGSGRQIRTGDARPEELVGRWQVEDPPQAPESLAQKTQAEPREPVNWYSLSSLALVVANLVPVAGAIYLDWNLGEVMVLYWAESGIIGLFNVFKMAVISRWMAILAGLFFFAHFGAFMAVHFLFIWGIFVKGFDEGGPGELAEIGQMFINLWPALAALVFSHGLSFFRNFIGRREYLGRTIRNQMSEPYSRIVAMHLVLIFGGGLSIILGGPTAVLLLVIAGKIIFDVRAHLKQHAKAP